MNPKNILPHVICCFLLFLLAIGAAEENQNPHSDDLKIISYNVLYGFNHGKNINDGANWIKEQNPDVVALEELNGFTQHKLESVAKNWGHNYAQILKENGFPVGLTSKEPIETIEKRLHDMHHGYLHCKTAGLNFFVIHLSPFDLARRRIEAGIICAKAKALIEREEPVIVLGDFNAFSPYDQKQLSNKKEFLQRMIAQEQKDEKRRNLDNGKMDFSVLQTFFDAGLIDTYVKTLDDAQDTTASFPSMLVSKSPEEQNKFSRRLDFILLNKKMAQWILKAGVCRYSVLNKISDHYPVMVVLRRNWHKP